MKPVVLSLLFLLYSLAAFAEVPSYCSSVDEDEALAPAYQLECSQSLFFENNEHLIKMVSDIKNCPRSSKQTRAKIEASHRQWVRKTRNPHCQNAVRALELGNNIERHLSAYYDCLIQVNLEQEEYYQLILKANSCTEVEL